MTDGPALAKMVARHANPAWTQQRERAARQRLAHALAGRRTSRAALLFVSAVVVAVLGLVAFRRVLLPEASIASGPNTLAHEDVPSMLLALEDGSSVRRASPDARITPVEVSPTSTRLRLEGGEARFEVTRNSGRRFQVLTSGMTVTVLGTVFRVAVIPSGARVSVERGRVAVECGEKRLELASGEQHVCSKTDPAADPKTAERTSEAAPPTSALIAPRPRPPSPSSWRVLAQEGDYRGAHTRMSVEGPSAVLDEPADLLFAADVARLSGHPAEAVGRLERVLRAHAADSRAPLAAFTLGRTLLDELGRPREAAEAFAKARKLSPSGAMAQDALAREVESWSRAGEASLARERAKQYLERYPTGRRLKAVRYHGGIE